VSVAVRPRFLSHVCALCNDITHMIASRTLCNDITHMIASRTRLSVRVSDKLIYLVTDDFGRLC